MAVKDTSKDYEHLLDFKNEDLEVSKINVIEDLGDEDASEEIKPKKVDPNYPEDWQNLVVNFRTFDDYVIFMEKLNSKPVPGLKTLIFDRHDYTGDKITILDFMEDENENSENT